ncbi:MAG TPA: FAD-dependent oxidoreductase [Bacteroidota bacterium]|nr:FAD-dependent oxidoreductase [Bacteroidota bacterium]
MRKRILVIGGLAAGPSAASKAKRTNPESEVVLFEQGEHVSYGICEIPYALAGETGMDRLKTFTPQRLREEKGVDVRLLHRVERIIPTRRVLVVRDLQRGSVAEETYDRLIIATGSQPKKLGVSGEDARNVFTVKSLSGAFALEKFLNEEQPKRAVIIGAGYIGIEMAEALRSRGLEVTMVHIHSLPLKGLEREARERVRSELESHGVQFVALARTQGFVVGSGQRVTHVVTDQGTFEADVVLVTIGVAPNTELAQNAGIRLGEAGGILTDQRQQTNLDHIYAAGDCCLVRNIVTGRHVYIPLATNASKQGWVAGENAAGGAATFRGAVHAIGVRAFTIEVVRVGVGTEEAEASGFDVVSETISAWSKVAVMPGSKKLWIKAIADKRSRRLLGVNMIGEEGAVLRANTFALAIQNRMTLDDLAQADLVYSPPCTPLWDPVLVTANVLRKKLR